MMLTTGIGGMVPLQTEDPSRICRRGQPDPAFLVERTRLGIPALFHVEALNGVVAPAASGIPDTDRAGVDVEPDLVEQMTEIIRKQMVRLGLRHALSPVMDIAFDPRWGRVHETYGEDPMLAAAFGVAFVKGLQGDDLSQGVVATAKHFIGFGLGQGGLNAASFEAGRRFTRDVVAFPIEAAINVAGLRSVMSAYGDVDGIPAGRQPRTAARSAARGDGIRRLRHRRLHGAAARARSLAASPTDNGEVARMGLHAGLDLEAPYLWAYGEVLAAEVEAGRVRWRSWTRRCCAS